MTKQSIFSNIDCNALETSPLSSTGNQDVTLNAQGALNEFAKMHCQQKAFSKFDKTKSDKKEGMYGKRQSISISTEPIGYSFKIGKKRRV